MKQKIKIAILDDYQNVALTMADWKAVEEVADYVGKNFRKCSDTRL